MPRVPVQSEAFPELFQQHRAQVLALCRRLLRSADSAEDATQDVFVRARQGHSGFDGSRPFANWVLGIAAHHCVDLLRRRATEARLFGSEDVERAAVAIDGPSPLRALMADEQREGLREALATLSDKYRVPLVLAVYQDLSYQEIAATLGVSRTHVAVLIFRAKQLLRLHLSRADATGRHR